MSSKRITTRVLIWLTPAVMLVVAGRQHYLARTSQLSPWEGGGFGMFSCADQPVTRFLRISITAADGSELSGLLPEDAALDRSWKKIQAMPSRVRVQAFAERLAGETWVPDGYDPFGTGTAGRPVFRRLHAGEPEPAPGSFPEPRSIHVEVVRRVFDAPSAAVRAETIASANAEIVAR